MNGGGMFRCHRRSQRLEKPQSAMDVIMAEEEVFVEEKDRLP